MFTYYDLQMFGLKWKQTIDTFLSLEVVGRGSEAQFQVSENLNKIP